MKVAHKWASWLHNPLPPRGSPTLQIWGQNQKWRTSGQGGYITPAAQGVPIAPERGIESEVAHKWARWLRNPCRLGDPHRLRAREKIKVAHKWASWLHNTCRLGGPQRFRLGDKIRSGPQVGKVATYSLPPRGPGTLQGGGQNQIWPTSGQVGYITLAPRGIPIALERWAGSEVAHKWERWLHNLAAWGIPIASERLADGKWSTSGQNGYIIPGN